MTCQFSLLGEVRVWRDDEELDSGSPQQSAVLACLLLAEGRPVSTDQLINDLWRVAAPVSAVITVRTYISRLRKLLCSSSGHAIHSTRAGYTVPVDKYSLDLLRFNEGVDAGRKLIRAGQPRAALAHLDDALSLWRGRPLAGIHADFVTGARTRLEELRLNAVIDRQRLKLGLGEHLESLEELSAYSDENPLEERLHELRMLALYRSARQADALTIYRNARTVLIETLGIEPGPELQELHQRILRADPGLLVPREQVQPVRPEGREPAQLVVAKEWPPPGKIGPGPAQSRAGTRLQLARQRGFVGRCEERRAFRAILRAAPRGQFSVLFCHGPCGIGKSTLLHLLSGDAASAGRHVTRIDGRQTGSCIAGFAAAAAPAIGDDNAALFVDSFECCVLLEQWLRETFLPDLSSGAVVVITGRRPPSVAWRADQAWSEALAIRPLATLSRAEAIALLDLRGVPAPLRDPIVRCVGGHPLALSMAADLARGAGTDWLRLHPAIHEALTDADNSGGDDVAALTPCPRDEPRDASVTLRSIG